MSGQQAAEPTQAEIYDRHFVPALFGQWGEIVCDAAGVSAGQRVLDVACGTGAATCPAARRVGSDGRVTGLDANPEMLAVARGKPEPIEWRDGSAEALPFADASFDAVISQFGFMFFADRVAALAEMQRCLRPGGRLAVAVCGAVDHSPGYAVLTELLQRLFGGEIAEAFRAPFVCGDADELLATCRAAGLSEPRVERREGRVRFDSVADLVATERACAWTLGGLLDERQFARLSRAAEESLAPFVAADGRIEFSMPSLIASAERPAGH